MVTSLILYRECQHPPKMAAAEGGCLISYLYRCGPKVIHSFMLHTKWQPMGYRQQSDWIRIVRCHMLKYTCFSKLIKTMISWFTRFSVLTRTSQLLVPFLSNKSYNETLEQFTSIDESLTIYVWLQFVP